MNARAHSGHTRGHRLTLSEAPENPARPGPYRRQVALVAILILVTSGLGLINPLMIKEAFLVLSRYQEGDAAANAELLRQLMVIVGVMVITPILSGGISIWQTYKNTMVGQS